MLNGLTGIEHLIREFNRVFIVVIPILVAGIGFGRCGVARILRERAGRVLLDLGRSRWRKIGNILMYLLPSFLLVVNLLQIYDDGNMVSVIGAMAWGLYMTSRWMQSRLGLRPGRVEIAERGLFFEGRTFLPWEQIRSWKWIFVPTPTLVLHLAIPEQRHNVIHGGIKNLRVPTRTRSEVNRLMLQYRGNGSQVPENDRPFLRPSQPSSSYFSGHTAASQLPKAHRDGPPGPRHSENSVKKTTARLGGRHLLHS